jgi:MOSC domain-containing protein
LAATVAWISVTPVKGLRLQWRDRVRLTEDGVPGDRAFFIVDDRGAMVSATRVGGLVSVVPEHDVRAGELSLRFPDGAEVAGPIELGEPEAVRFGGLTLRSRSPRWNGCACRRASASRSTRGGFG